MSSRKCPACKKWLASGQYVCKCGAGENAAVSLKPEEKLHFDKVVLSLRSHSSVGSYFQAAFSNLHEREVALQLTGDFLKDVKYLNAAGSNGDFVTGLVHINSPDLLRLVLKDRKEKIETLVDTKSRLNVLVLCVLWGRADCLDVLLEHKDRIDFEAKEPTSGKTIYLLACDLLDGGSLCQHGNLSAVSLEVRWGSLAPIRDTPDFESRTQICNRMLTAINVARGVDAQRGEHAMAMRSQKAAVSQEIETPAPFPRHVWLMIIPHCSVRERNVTLPLCCRFFFNLQSRQERLCNVLSYFNLVDVKAERARGSTFPWHDTRTVALRFEILPISPAFAWFLCINADVALRHRLRQLMESHAEITADSVLRRLLFHGQFSAPHGPARLWDLGTEELQPLGGTDMLCVRHGEVLVSFEIRSPLPEKPRTTFKLRIANAEKRVSFRLCVVVNRNDFGSSAGGPREFDRLSQGCIVVAEILGNEMLRSPQHFVKFCAVLFAPNAPFLAPQNVYSQHVTPLQFFESLLIGMTSELQVKVTIGQGLDISRSQDGFTNQAVEQQEEELGLALKALRWNTEKLCEFLSKHGLDACLTAVREKKLCGKHLVDNMASSEFIGDDISVKEKKELESRLGALRKKYFGK